MNRPKLVSVAALFLMTIAPPASSAEGDYALINANLFDGINERTTENVTILVSDGRIERIETGNVDVPDGYELIDVEGNYLMPGMIDVHTHLNTIDRAERALVSGVTTVRLAGTRAYEGVALRELVRLGKLPGPDIHASGVFVLPDIGPAVLADPRLAEFHGGVDGDDAMRRIVSINADHDVDVIKTSATQRSGLPTTDPRQQVYTERQLRVIVEEAARHDIPVMAHAHGDIGARAAVSAGVRSIEHGTYLSDETLELMKERGTWFVPTYITIVDLKEEWQHYVLRLRGRHMLPNIERGIRSAHQMGVKLATGADNSYEESSINRISLEIEIFAGFGLSNFDAIQAGTTSAAELLRIDDRTGRIAEGFEADIIAVPGNPLENIKVLQDVLLVMSNGNLALKRIPFAVTE